MLDRPDNLPMFIATVWTMNGGRRMDDDLSTPIRHTRYVERRRALSADDFRRELLADSADDEITVGPVSLSRHQ